MNEPVRCKVQCWLRLCLMGILTLFVLLQSGSARRSRTWDHIAVEIPAYILKKVRVSATNVSERFPPVAVVFFDEDSSYYTLGVGTIALDRNGGMAGIATAGHLFPRQFRTGRSFYRTLRPLGDAWNAIERIDRFAFGTNGLDAVWCIPGESKPIEGFSSYSATRRKRLRTWVVHGVPSPRSALSGEVVRVIGVAAEADGTTWEILLYDGRVHESGLGTLSDSNEIYIISSMLELTPEWRRALSVPESYKRISLAQRVRINL